MTKPSRAQPRSRRTTTAATPPRPPPRASAHPHAVARAALIGVHDYDIDLDVTAAEGFTSHTRIGFSARTAGRTFVDVAPRTLDKVLLDGVEVDVGGWPVGRLGAAP